MSRDADTRAREHYRALHWGKRGKGAIERLAVASLSELAPRDRKGAADPAAIETATLLGDLVELAVKGPGGKASTIRFKGKRPRLAVDPESTRLLVAGGVYKLPKGMRWTVKTIVYRTRKGLDVDPVEYEHEFSAPLPVAIVAPKSGRLVLSGGGYHVEERGFVN